MENIKIKQTDTNKKITFSLKQDIGSLDKIVATLEDNETNPLICADFGVVSGKILSNTNIGVPNAKVGIFLPLDDKDQQDSIVSALYPYITTSTLNSLGYRYNLLPVKKQHSFHTPVGTLFDIEDIRSNEIIKYIYEKYYKFCTSTNENGEFLIYGVPTGAQILHVDIDISDVGYLSMRPEVLIDLGEDINNFVVDSDGIYSYRSSQNLDNLIQIKSFTREIIVSPIVGDREQCDVGITNVELDINFNFTPYAIFFGSITADAGRPITTRGQYITNLRRDVQNINAKTSLQTRINRLSLIGKEGDLVPVKHPIIVRRTDIYGNTKEFRYPNGHFVMFVPMNYRFVIFDINGNEVIQTSQNGLPTEGIYSFEFIIDADPDSENAAYQRSEDSRDFDFGKTNYTKAIGFTPKDYNPDLYFLEQPLRSFNGSLSGGTATQLLYGSLYNEFNTINDIATIGQRIPIVAVNDNMDFSSPELRNNGNKLRRFISRGGFSIFTKFKFSKENVNKYTFYQDIEQKEVELFEYLAGIYYRLFSPNNESKFVYQLDNKITKIFGNLLMLKLNTTQPFSHPDLAFTTVNKPNYLYTNTSDAPTNSEINSVVRVADFEYPITFSTSLYKLSQNEFKKIISYDQEINGNIYNTNVRNFYKRREDIPTTTYIEVDSLVDTLNKYKIDE